MAGIEQLRQRLENKRKDTQRLIKRADEILNEEMADDKRKSQTKSNKDYWEGRVDGLDLAIRLLKREELGQ